MLSRQAILKSKPETLETLTRDATIYDLDSARAEKRRSELAKLLGERAAEGGEIVGIASFMAIGFPELTPAAKKYKQIVIGCTEAKRIPTGDCMMIGDKWKYVVGIKSDEGDRGLAYRAVAQYDGSYAVQAELLCTRALLGHNQPDGRMYGTDEDPYAVKIVSNVTSNGVLPIQRIFVHLDFDDTFRSGEAAHTNLYTQRLLAEL